MVQLIDKTRLADILDISVRIPDKRFAYFLQQAQEFDLKPLIGCNAFYTDILNNKALPDYVALLDGEDYTDCDGNTVNFQGLDKVIAHFWWSRYVIEGNVRDTGWNVVEKDSEYSSSISFRQRQAIQANHEGIAKIYFDEVVKYLKQKVDDGIFAIYEDCCSYGSDSEDFRMKSDII